MSSKLKDWSGSLIPGIITLAVVFGPSKMTITTKLGAEFGYTLLWIVAVAIFFMAIFTSMAARIGMATKQSLLNTIKLKWGSKFSAIIGIGIFLVTISFQAGNAIGSGVALAELTGTSTGLWVILSSLIGISLLFFRRFYKILEVVMIGIVISMLFSFLVTCIVARPSISESLAGLRPQVPKGSQGLIIAFIASCFSLVGAFYQSYLVQERARNNKNGNEIKDRSLTGILLLGLMSIIVMICAASVLHANNIQVNTAADMGRALVPLFGKQATMFFLIGLFGASFSSLIGNATLGGTLLADSLGYGSSMDSPKAKSFIALIIIIGAAIAILFGHIPLELIVFAQSITVLIVPLIGIAMFAVSNDISIMGKHKNTLSVNIAAIAGLVLVFILAGLNIQKLFF
ncbi:Nramp family divalent metal transporter [Chitinophaga defluvii]|uniref:Nramp family divalent metal transporter n=1 Tax=Chitinophaga defluvii TaxID=3163343 RepID=A0ABV2TDX9_9BACT